jgi:hypothetical protein
MDAFNSMNEEIDLCETKLEFLGSFDSFKRMMEAWEGGLARKDVWYLEHLLVQGQTYVKEMEKIAEKIGPRRY